MPRTQNIGSHLLQIDVASPPSWTFAAGDTIIGTVIRRSPIVTPEATVTLTLIGRVKTKITVKRNSGNGSRTDHYRGRWFLVGSEKSQVLHRGPLHLAQGQNSGNVHLSWSFSITIPTRPADSLARSNPGARTYLPLNNIADHPLPGTFYSSRDGWGTRSEGFVEYYLESVLRYGRGGSYETCKATFPVSLQHPSSGPKSPSAELQRCTFQHTVRTQRLLPGMEHAELTFKQKTQKIFQSSKVPTFGYSIAVLCPRVIQLESPSPIPLVIHFYPNTGATSADIQDTPQQIRLNWVRMILKSMTSVLAPGNFNASSTHNDNHSRDYDLGLSAIFSRLENPIVFESAKGNQQVDVGTLLQLVLHSSGLQAGNRRLPAGPAIHPDFATYNIKHWHSLEWELSFTVADETKQMKVTTSVRILPPIRSDPNPPEYSKN